MKKFLKNCAIMAILISTIIPTNSTVYANAGEVPSTSTGVSDRSVNAVVEVLTEDDLVSELNDVETITGTTKIIIINANIQLTNTVVVDMAKGKDIVITSTNNNTLFSAIKKRHFEIKEGSQTLTISNITLTVNRGGSTANIACVVKNTKIPEGKYTVTYHGNGHTNGEVPVDIDSPYVKNTTVTVLTKGNLTKTNSTFIGWNTQADGKGVDYTEGSTFVITGNITLYAQWKETEIVPIVPIDPVIPTKLEVVTPPSKTITFKPSNVDLNGSNHPYVKTSDTADIRSYSMMLLIACGLFGVLKRKRITITK